MSDKNREEFGLAPLMIVCLMVLAGLCVWCIASMPEGFLQVVK